MKKQKHYYFIVILSILQGHREPQNHQIRTEPAPGPPAPTLVGSDLLLCAHFIVLLIHICAPVKLQITSHSRYWGCLPSSRNKFWVKFANGKGLPEHAMYPFCIMKRKAAHRRHVAWHSCSRECSQKNWNQVYMHVHSIELPTRLCNNYPYLSINIWTKHGISMHWTII